MYYYIIEVLEVIQVFIGKTKDWLRLNQNVLGFCSFLACLCLVALSFAVCAPIYNNIDSASATAGTPTASTLTFTSTNPVASVSLAMGSPTGTFATSSSSEKAAFSISTNNYTGYTLTMTSTGSNTTLTDGNSHNISTISSSTTEAIFSSSDAVGQALNNRWGYIPSYYNSTANTTTYYPAPTSVNAATLRTTSSANSSNGVDNADDYTIGLGFRADYNSPSGTYSNDTFILEFVANPVAYTITYNKNTTDTVTNMPANQSGDTPTTSITLSSTIPTRNKYFFMGWCHGTVTTANNYDTCDGTIYNPSGDGTNLDFGIDQTATNSPTLYAMWDRTYTLTFKTATNATSVVFNGETYTNNQTKTIKASQLTNPYHIYGNYATRYAFSSWTITAGSLGNSNYQNTTYTVTDDAVITLTGQQVTTAMQNLSASSCTTTARPVYDNRDNTVYWIQKLADGNCWMLDNLGLGGSESTINLTSNDTNIPNSHSISLPVSTSPWNTDNTAAYTTLLVNADYVNTVTSTYGLGGGKIGAYYNFCSASAGTYCYDSSSGASDVNYDICPKGWRMPHQYTGLFEAYNSDQNSFLTALSVTKSGEIWNSAIGKQGVASNLWAGTIKNNSTVSRMLLNDSGNVVPNADGPRGLGWSVRCVQSYTITFKTNNAAGIVFNGITYTDGQTVAIPIADAGVKKFSIYGAYDTRYAFSSWSKTAGSFDNQSLQNTTYTVTGDATITLTGQYVSTTMQNLGLSNCTTTARPVYDTRDNSVYWIKRLADNKCWMLDNLALDISNTTIRNSLSTSNTNATTASLNSLKGTSVRNPITDPDGPYSTAAVSTSWDGERYTIPIADPRNNNATYIPGNASVYSNAKQGFFGAGKGKGGLYYNYCAASAGSYCYNEDKGIGDATEDICPAGWKMPTSYPQGDFWNLCSSLKGSSCNENANQSEQMDANDTNSVQYQLSITLTGGIYSGGYPVNSSIYLWSSSRRGYGAMYYFVAYEDVIATQNMDPRDIGRSVRCILGN